MKKIEIFSGKDCNYCRKAKDLLTENGINFEDFDIVLDEHRSELVKRLPRSKSIPQIFIDGQHIGGYEDLKLLKTRGDL